MDFSENQVTSSVEILENIQEERRRLEEELVNELNHQLEIVQQQAVTEEQNLVLEIEQRRERRRQERRETERVRSLSRRIADNIADEENEMVHIQVAHDRATQELMELQETLECKQRRLEELELDDCSIYQLLADEEQLLAEIEEEEWRRGGP